MNFFQSDLSNDLGAAGVKITDNRHCHVGRNIKDRIESLSFDCLADSFLCSEVKDNEVPFVIDFSDGCFDQRVEIAVEFSVFGTMKNTVDISISGGIEFVKQIFDFCIFLFLLIFCRIFCKCNYII